MASKKSQRQTTVGVIDAEVLAYTAGRDVALDWSLIEADCVGTAAHVTMLSRMPKACRVLSQADAKKVIAELVAILRRAQVGKFSITLEDQDVHLAVERNLTAKLGDLGKKVHTCRSRNDQVAVDLRLFAKEELLGVLAEIASLAGALSDFARRHAAVPMVGRTHLQPAMPSSVGLWADAHAAALLDDAALVLAAYQLNDQCPLGAAASYGVPLPIDRQLVSDLLGFSHPVGNVLHAINSRGKLESIILGALTQVMLTLSRLAQDLVLFTMPEFGYFALPAAFCTGSSIMPQKKNPDVLELVRSRAARVTACQMAVLDIVRSSASGYNRDLQDAKEPFMEGLAMTRATLSILAPLIAGLGVNREKLLAAFTPDVFATDRALELVAGGMPFRDAYHHVKAHLDELQNVDPVAAIAKKTHLGAPAGLNFDGTTARIIAIAELVSDERAEFHAALSKLLGVRWPVE
ncbi:MAG: argininosuccinate lyase [Kiritimatiellaeota bacterium]|nr:argininosuccinate lyase [Kiritimatiellota bacterium]